MRAGHPERAALAALIVLAAVLRFATLGHQGFWFDEANTALLIKFSPGRMISLIPQTESTPPLYYCVAWVWSRIFGHGEAGLRSLSATAGVLTVPVAFAAGRELLQTNRAGLIAAALTACNPLLIWYSQEARSYALLVLFSGVALVGFIRAVKEPSPRALALWAAGSALALLTHYYAAVAIVPQAAWLLWRHRRARPVWWASATVAVVAAALIPLALAQNRTGHDSWIAHTPLHLRLAQILPQFLLGTGAPARKPLKFVGFALAAAALVLACGRWRGRDAATAEQRRVSLAAGLALAGFVLSLIFAVVLSDGVLTRNLIALWLPAALAVTVGLARDGTRIRWLGAGLTAALCAIGLIAVIGVFADYDLQRPDWRVVARALHRPPPAGGERVILIQHFKTLLPLSLYLPDIRAFDGDLAHRVGELDVIGFSSPQQPLCWWGAACNLIPSEVQASYPIAGLRQAARLRLHRFTIVRLVAPSPVPVTRQAIAAALQTTTLRHDELLIQRHAAG